MANDPISWNSTGSDADEQRVRTFPCLARFAPPNTIEQDHDRQALADNKSTYVKIYSRITDIVRDFERKDYEEALRFLIDGAVEYNQRGCLLQPEELENIPQPAVKESSIYDPFGILFNDFIIKNKLE